MKLFTLTSILAITLSSCDLVPNKGRFIVKSIPSISDSTCIYYIEPIDAFRLGNTFCIEDDICKYKIGDTLVVSKLKYD